MLKILYWEISLNEVNELSLLNDRYLNIFNIKLFFKHQGDIKFFFKSILHNFFQFITLMYSK